MQVGQNCIHIAAKDQILPTKLTGVRCQLETDLNEFFLTRHNQFIPGSQLTPMNTFEMLSDSFLSCLVGVYSLFILWTMAYLVLEDWSAAVMGQHDKSPISTVRGSDSEALPLGSGLSQNVSELLVRFSG